MTDEEFAAWGKAEWHRRLVEMKGINSEADLKAVQAACKVRRKLVGLSIGQAAKAVVVAQRMERGESLSFALR